MNNLPIKPKIKDGWCIIPTDKYVLFRGKGIFKVEGESLREFIQVLLPLLDKGHTLREILNILDEYREEDIVKALTLLNDEGILEDASTKIPKNLSPNELKHYQSNLEYFSRFSENKYESQSNLGKARVAIIGAGALGWSIASSLASSGVNRVLLLDNKKVETRLKDKTEVGKNNNRITTKSLAKKIDHADISQLSGKYDLVVCAPDYYNPSLFDLVNKTCLHNRIPWIPVYHMEEEGFIGPLAVSKEGPCFNCFQIRLLNNSEHLEEDKVFNDYLLKNGHSTKHNIPHFYADVLSRFAALDIVHFLSKAKPSSTLGNVYIQNFEVLSGSLHLVIKVPNCPSCKRRLRKRLSIKSLIINEQNKWNQILKIEETNGDVTTLIQEIEKHVNEKTGILKRSLHSNSLKHLNLFGNYEWLAIGSPPERFHKPHDFIFSGGTGETFEAAKCSALAEAIERYCCESRSENITATYREVKKHAMNPRDVALYSESQYSQENFHWKRFSEDSKISWTPGFNLITKEALLVPTDFVYTGYGQDELCSETSNGAAAHTSKVEAILRGIFELIERDGIMIMWFNRLPMPKISSDTLPPEMFSMVKKVNDFGFDVIIQNITTDLEIPAFCVFLVNRLKKKPAMISGAGCHINPKIAIMKGLREAVRFFTDYLSHPERYEQIKTLSFDEIRSPLEHGELYYDPEMLKHLDFMIDSNNYQNLSEIKDLSKKDPKENLRLCLDIFRKKKMDVIAVDCTSVDIVNTGLYVVKIIIPGMQPIGFGMRNQKLGGRRLYNVPMKLGYSKRPTREEELNMIPHFFA
ncbi:MAG: TOMM precursor leader peptide-binding protein [Thermodesulfobacteriota bacterium]